MLLFAPCIPARAQQPLPNNTAGDEDALPVPAGTRVPADSVRMVVLPETGEAGFIIPRSAALHYRNLVLDLLPALEEKIRLLEDASAKQRSLSDNRLDQIKNLEAQRDNLKEQVTLYASDTIALQEQVNEVNQARKREIRRKKFWRSSNLLFAGTTAVLAVVAIGR